MARIRIRIAKEVSEGDGRKSIAVVELALIDFHLCMVDGAKVIRVACVVDRRCIE